MDFEIAGQLFPNLLTVIVQFCSTLVIFFFMKKFLWLPVRDMLAKRSEAMQADLSDAKKQRVEAEGYLADANEQLKVAGETAKNIIERGKIEGERLKTSIVSEAQREAELKLQSARTEIEHEKQEMRNALHNEVVEVAMAAAEKLVEEKLYDKDQKELDRFIKDLRS